MSCGCNRKSAPTAPLTRDEAANNAVRAAGRALGAFLRGQPVRVSPETRAARLRACSACPELRGGICTACGCDVARKAGAATENCPRGRWRD